MYLKELPEVTHEMVLSGIKEIEEKYSISTQEFLNNAQARDRVEDSDAMDWHYLLMQKRAFEECKPRFLYQHIQKVTPADEQEMHLELVA